MRRQALLSGSALPAAGLARFYLDLQRQWTLVDRSADYARLVTPTGNSTEPIHRWFHLKEAYSHGLVDRLFKDAERLDEQEVRLLDPFCGSATTLVSASQLTQASATPLRATGIELNPFLFTLSRAKCAALTKGPILAPRIQLAADLTLERLRKTLRRKLSTQSTTLNNDRFFNPDDRHRLLALAAAIDEEQDDEVRSILQVCLAAAVEPASKLRRDGRTMRYAPEKAIRSPHVQFKNNVARVSSDIAGLLKPPPGDTLDVINGDSRNQISRLSNSSFNWIIFSPPYPNNIDYTEVYKLENWVLGFWQSPHDMRAARLRTLRSHPSLRFPDQYAFHESKKRSEVEKLISPLQSVIPDDKYASGRKQIVSGYVDDMLALLEQCYSVAEPGCRLVYIVGNSHHGERDQGYVIAADLLLAKLAEIAGWTVEEIRVARRPNRRAPDDEFMRESVVALRKIGS